MRWTLGPVEAMLETEERISLIFGAGLLVALTLLSGLITDKVIGRPLEVLAGAMRDVEGGDLSRRVPVETVDEVGRLSQGFNRMLERLSNMGQSSNDVFPSAVHLAALDEVTHDLLPAMGALEEALDAKAKQFTDVVKAGRTHLMDAVPVTLGQEFGGYAAQVRLGVQRVEATLRRVGQIPLGGTATGTGLNTHPEFAAKVREKLASDTGLAISAPLDPFEAQGNRDALVELSGALKVYAVSLNKIANDLALMGSGPRAGLAELRLPELQKGSSIMPGKVNPVIPEVVIQVAGQVIGNDAAITIGGMQGQFELNVRVPLIARNLLGSIKLLASASRLLDEKCVQGLEANEEMTERHAEATLATATALNPHIGYDAAAAIVKDAADSGRPLREVALEHGVSVETLDEALDHRAMARPHDQD